MTALVGTLFNDIVIQRKDDNNAVKQNVKIPLFFGPKEKYLARLENNPDLETTQAVVLPLISFELIGIDYDNNRKLSTVGKIHSKDGQGAVNKSYNPVPYDLNYRVYVYTNNFDDGSKIIEQILPFFTPGWSASVFLMPDSQPTQKTDVYVNLENVSMDDQYEGNFEKRRALVWTLNLKVQTYFYGPAAKAKVIKFAEMNTRIGDPSLYSQARKTTWTPYLDLGSGPVDPLLINEDDDWTYQLTIEE